MKTLLLKSDSMRSEIKFNNKIYLEGMKIQIDIENISLFVVNRNLIPVVKMSMDDFRVTTENRENFTKVYIFTSQLNAT
jgi:hypothetical protein